jgi:hypothetical protein
MVYWDVMLMDPCFYPEHGDSKFLQNAEPRLHGVTSQKTSLAGTALASASQALVQHINLLVPELSAQCDLQQTRI